ncbi:THAP domain containing 12a [Synchiropus picturatus]
MQGHCAVLNCNGSKSDPHPLYRFPLDEERCKKWVEKCQRQDLGDTSAQELFRYYRVCGKHFETTSVEGDDDNKTLKDDAVPTIFEAPPQTGGTKRSTDPTATDGAQNKGRKKMKKSPAETGGQGETTVPEEEKHEEHLKSLFEVLVLLAEQNIPPSALSVHDPESNRLNTFNALLEYRMSCGGGALNTANDKDEECCTSAQLDRLIEVCEKSVRRKLVEEVNENGFFSLITDDLVKISGLWYLPVFLRYVTQSNVQCQRFAGFLPFEDEESVLAERLLSELSNDWGLKMEQCRGQAHSFPSIHFHKMKFFAAKLLEKFPSAMLTVTSSRNINMLLASSAPLSGVQLVMGTFKKIEMFFSICPSLHSELDHVISVFFPDKEEKASELKEISRTAWTRRPDAFEVAMEIYEALLLFMDSVHDNEDLKWSDQVTHNALEISKALADFEFITSLVVLKNVMSLTRAFGKNLLGKSTDTFFAANSLNAVIHSLREVSDNIDVYHEFWIDEAVNIAATLEIPVKVPRSFLRKYQLNAGSVRPEGYYKDHLSAPLLKHMISELSELFSEDHLNALRCLTLVPAVVEQQKTSEHVEEYMQVYKNDLPNIGSLSAELHCWWVKWSKRGKVETFPCSLDETLQLADVKFFPNMLAVLRLVGTLPTLALEDSRDLVSKSFEVYVKNTPDAFKSKSLAFLTLNSDICSDLDSMVELYISTYPSKS